MKINWGTWIAILYGGFVIMIVSLVAATTFRKPDLVAEDYYQQEISFQKKMDAANAAASLNEPLSITVSGSEVIIHFPGIFEGTSILGTVHFYAPADAAADRYFTLSVASGAFHIPRNQLGGIRYEVQVDFSADGKAYYQSIPLNLQ